MSYLNNIFYKYFGIRKAVTNAVTNAAVSGLAGAATGAAMGSMGDSAQTLTDNHNTNIDNAMKDHQNTIDKYTKISEDKSGSHTDADKALAKSKVSDANDKLTDAKK